MAGTVTEETFEEMLLRWRCEVAETGEVWLPPCVKGCPTGDRLRTLGLEGVPGKLNYWRLREKR